MDLHEDIHRAVENYQDENEFRRWLNSAIQNSRGVTFLLQKRKAKWPDFDAWYGAWQEDAKTNPVLDWGVRSRNRIVKEEDLQTFSQAIISYYGERLQEAEEVITVPPSTTTADMLHSFRDLTRDKPSRRKGWVHIQRRWVDDQLPQYELVAALREMYAAVARVVTRAHTASGIDDCLAPTFPRTCVNAEIDPDLECLGPGDPIPAGMIDATTGELMRFSVARLERDDSLAELGRQRYGGFAPTEWGDPIGHAPQRLELSRRFLEADGYAGPMLLLFRGANETRLNGVFFAEDEPRELKIAATVNLHGAWPYDGAVFATESWFGARGDLVDVPEADTRPSNEDFFDPDPVGGRQEALMVYALAADGRSRVLIQPFARTRDGIEYGELIDDSSGNFLPALLRPVWRRWGKWRNGPPGGQ